jgi:ATP-dependent Clp protease ATP-binding subunit ClpA
MLEQAPRRLGPFQSGAGFRPALGRSREEAFLRNHHQIRPGHILLGVALISDVRVDAMLATLRVARTELAERAAGALGRALPAHGGGPDLAFTPRGVHVVDRATLLAERLGWGWLGAAHLLAVLSEEDWGSAPRVMGELGVTAGAVHAALASAARLIPPEPSDEDPIYWWDWRTAGESSRSSALNSRGDR